MRRRGLAWVLALLVLISVLSPGLAAESGGETVGKAVFESSVPDKDGYFEVTLTVSDMTFRVLQMTLRYDTAVIQPVNETGEAAEDFSDFAIFPAEVEEELSLVGPVLRPATGLIGFCVFSAPGTKGTHINADTEVETGNGLLLLTFRFKRLTDGDTGLQIATEEKGEPYQKSCPQGIVVGNQNGQFDLEVLFKEAAKPDSGKTESHRPAEPKPPQKTAEDLLKGAVFLRIGSHAAVVQGGLTGIYPGERNVTAYAHDNRTFVPVRFVAERLGAQVDWENETQTVIIQKDGHEVRMAIGSSTFTLDGESRSVDAPAELNPTASPDGNYRTMVPIRFVSEALGYQVEWDQARSLVIIAPESLGWDPAGSVESQAMDQAVSLYVFSNFV